MVSCDLPEVTRSTRQTSSGALIYRHLLINNIQDPPSLLPTHLPLPCHTISYIPSPPMTKILQFSGRPGYSFRKLPSEEQLSGIRTVLRRTSERSEDIMVVLCCFRFFFFFCLVYVSKRGQANDTLINTLH